MAKRAAGEQERRSRDLGWVETMVVGGVVEAWVAQACGKLAARWREKRRAAAARCRGRSACGTCVRSLRARDGAEVVRYFVVVYGTVAGTYLLYSCTRNRI